MGQEVFVSTLNFFFPFSFSSLTCYKKIHILYYNHQRRVSKFQKLVCQIAPSPSPQRWCTSSIISTDLQMPLQLQSNDAAQAFPAWAFHSQSIGKGLKVSENLKIFFDQYRALKIIYQCSSVFRG